MKVNLLFKCLKSDCNEIFKTPLDYILKNKYNCPYCSGHKVGLSNCLATKNPQLTSEWHPTKNGDLTPYDVTVGSNKRVWWICGKNPKHEWKTNVSNRKYNNCPYCCSSKPKASEDYNLLVYNPELASEWNYEKNEKKPEDYCPNSSNYVWWVCEKGHEWRATINNRNKAGCPICNESKGEKLIEYFLTNNNICFKQQYRFNNCRNILPLPFDFYLTNYNLCIEYHGKQHYKPIEYFGGVATFKKQQKRDKIKENYCIDNKILLLIIPYWDFDKIEQILDEYINNIKTGNTTPVFSI